MPDVNGIVIQVGTALTEAERLVIEGTLQCTGWNMSRCASVLGIDYGTLYAKLRAYRLAEQSGSGTSATRLIVATSIGRTTIPRLK
jgi:DNA-binding NtrC family response regulator